MRVRVLLDALGDALVSWRLSTIRAIEGDLREAVAALTFDTLLTPSHLWTHQRNARLLASWRWSRTLSRGAGVLEPPSPS